MEQKTRTRSSLFRFKQFAINQAHCTMRINTDGVLLGALARMPSLPPELKEMRILDVGTGTGVIALMLAQRFDEAEVHGIEIDEVSTHTAAQNALLSPFSERMCIFPSALQDFVPPVGDASYSLIVSNPPFFIDALKNPDKQKELARHTGIQFFEILLKRSEKWLRAQGVLQVIVPPDLGQRLAGIAKSISRLTLEEIQEIYSFPYSQEPIRLVMRFVKTELADSKTEKPVPLIIYDAPGQYSLAYKNLLKDFFLAF